MFSARSERADNTVGVDFAGSEAALGKIRVVRSVGEILWFEAEPGARAVGTAHAAGGTIEVFAVVELDACLAGRLVYVAASRDWVIEFEKAKSTVELGLALRVCKALGLTLQLVSGPAARTSGKRTS
jgi:hypothetical protein